MYYSSKIPWIVKTVAPTILYKITRVERSIYLTFDDGPCDKTTPHVLELLDEYNAKATFFCVGNNVYKHPNLFENILKRGHSVGNHTFNHKNGWATKNTEYYNDIELANKLINSNLFRPPYGKIKPSQVLYLNKRYKVVMWDVLAGDFDPNTSKEKCFDNIKNNSNNGSIVVFHDSIKAKDKMLFALEQTLIHFSKLEYNFEAI